MLTSPKNRHPLFQQRMDALYQSDAEGRIVCTNEWQSSPPPRFHLMRTAQGSFFRFQAGMPDEIVCRLELLCEQEPPDRFSETLPLHHAQYLDVLTEHTAVQKLWAGPAYIALGDVPLSQKVLQDTAQEATLINRENAHLLRERMEDWLPDVPHRQPFVAVVKDGCAVSVCASVRITDAVHCAGVETLASHRHRGYASAVVARWASVVRSQGATPFYSTSWDNVASQRVAQRLGMTLAGVDFRVT